MHSLSLQAIIFVARLGSEVARVLLEWTHTNCFILQSSLWVAAIMFLCLTVFYLILMIMFCIRVKNRRNEAIMSQFRHEDENVSQSSSSSEPEELGDVVEEKKTQPNPFTYT